MESEFGMNMRDGRNIVLTGKKRKLNDGRAGIRNSTHARQYKCLICDHVGWSRHTDLERREKREAKKCPAGS